MQKYYMQNKYGRVEEMYFHSDEDAFNHTIKRNKRSDENWKVYDERGNLIYGLVVI